MKICHMTSAHPQEDIRIFQKECISLAKAGFDTYQVSHGNCYIKDGVHLIGVGEKQKGRLRRMFFSTRKVYTAAKQLDADIYHLHDPELLHFGLKLKKQGKKVIFDSHEEVSAQIMDKTWIPLCLRSPISSFYKLYETFVTKRIDAVIAATPHIAKSFQDRCKRVTVVNNYPKLDDVLFHDTPYSQRKAIVCYAGGIDEDRGEKIMIEAMDGVDATLVIAGDHDIADFGNVRYVGRLDRKGINNLYGSAKLGLCILKPIENYYYSKPIKVYEYMAAGLPYICSDFPDWRRVAEESGAGICIDPSNVSQIRTEIINLLNDDKKAKKMGDKGRDYVVRDCNWGNEERMLLSLYSSL